MVVLAVHLHCGGSCLVESFSASTQTPSTGTEEPCHKNATIPSKGQPQSHESNGLCSQRSVVQGKVSVDGKVALELTGALPIRAAVIALSYSAVTRFLLESPPGASPDLVPTAILRI